MLKLLRLLQGYIIFEATGGFTERFLNLCKINNINLWNVKNNGVKIVAFTTEAEFELLKNPAHNSGMEIKLIKRCGLKHFIIAHKWRSGAIVGAVIVLTFILFMSTRVWTVETVSVSGVKIKGFTDAVGELGIKSGAKISQIDTEEVEEALLERFPQASWVSVNIFGSKIQIEYSYAQKHIPFADTISFTNVVARKGGKITLVQCYSGTPEVKKGDYVPEGTLLISGVVKNGDLSESTTHASGKVFAKTDSTYSVAVNKSDEKKLLINTDSLYYLNIFSLKVPLGRKAEDAESSQTDVLLNGNSTALPLGFCREDYLNAKSGTVSFTKLQGKYTALLDCIKHKRENYDDAELLKITYSVKDGDTLAVNQRIVCVENIAKEFAGAVE